MTELWDVYDGNRRLTGRTMVRGEIAGLGDYHLVIHIWLINSKGELLIQKRADTVSWRPGYWAATSGSVVAGEDSLTTALREAQEELGLLLDPKELSLLFSVKREDDFCDVWLVQKELELDNLTLQTAEVSAVKWSTEAEIRQMVHDGSFIAYTYLDRVFELLNRQ